MRLPGILMLLLLPLCAAFTQAKAAENCGVSLHSSAAPQRIVTLNQHSTELLLQLGVGTRMVGTAYPDDAMLSSLNSDYQRIPMLSKYYPTIEQMLITDTDFIVGGFPSAFSPQGVGERSWWYERGVNTFLLPVNCAARESLDVVWQSITELGDILQVEQAAAEEVARQKQALAQRKPVAGEARVLIWSHDDNTPYVAGTLSISDEMIRLAGGTNAADEVERPWGHMTWEAILMSRPDLIVLIDADWAPAKDKLSFIKAHPVLSRQLGSIPVIAMPFSETIAGIRTVQGILRINNTLSTLSTARGMTDVSKLL